MDALDKEEFLALSNQKADDWREITRISASFLGIAGVFFTAGLAKGSAWVVILAPLPMFLGVLQMSRNARLQLQMITYLSVYGTSGETSWEKNIAQVRPIYWREAPRGKLAAWVEGLSASRGRAWGRRLTNPLSWDSWFAIAVLVGLGIDSVPLFTGLDDSLAAFCAGVASLALAGILAERDIERIEPERARWEALWNRHKQGHLLGMERHDETR